MFRRFGNKIKGFSEIKDIDQLAEEAIAGNVKSQEKYGKYLLNGQYGAKQDASQGLLWLARSVNNNPNSSTHYGLFQDPLKKSPIDFTILNAEEIEEIIVAMSTPCSLTRGSITYPSKEKIELLLKVISNSIDILDMTSALRIRDLLSARDFSGNAKLVEEFAKQMIADRESASTGSVVGEPVAAAVAGHGHGVAPTV
jgi:TPR repeat protein